MLRRPNRRTSVAALDLEKIEGLAANGLTLEQIAAALSIDVRTLYNKRKRFKEVRDAIDRGAAAGIKNVANALYEAAVVDKNTTAMIFYLKARAGWRDQGPIVEVHNEQNNVKIEKVDLDELTGKAKLLRDTIQVLRDLGVPAALELPARTSGPSRTIPTIPLS